MDQNLGPARADKYDVIMEYKDSFQSPFLHEKSLTKRKNEAPILANIYTWLYGRVNFKKLRTRYFLRLHARRISFRIQRGRSFGQGGQFCRIARGRDNFWPLQYNQPKKHWGNKPPSRDSLTQMCWLALNQASRFFHFKISTKVANIFFRIWTFFCSRLSSNAFIDQEK